MFRKLLLDLNIVKPKKLDDLIYKNQSLNRKQDKILARRVALRKQIDKILNGEN